MKPEDLLQNPLQNQTPKCTTGCPVLDRLLNGGISTNSITELVSESGCGKTQLSLQLLLTSQLFPSFSSSLYLHSDDSPFPLRRLRQLSLFYPNLQNPLDRILVHPLHSANHLLDLLPHINSLLTRPPRPEFPVRLIIIDSIAALFRSEFENNPRDLKKRSGLFFKISGKLKSLAREFGVAVVVTNQVVDVMDASGNGDGLRIGNPMFLCSNGRRVCAALGLSWANCVNTRLFLSREEERVGTREAADGDGDGNDGGITRTRRFIRVVFAPHLPDSFCEFVIKKEGLFGIQR